MSLAYWIIIVLVFINAIYRIRKKDYYNIAFITAIGVFLPLCIYHLNWSKMTVHPIANDFYLIFIYFGIMVIFTSVVERKCYPVNVQYVFSIKSQLPIQLFNIIYVVSCLLENIILSGNPFPMVFGIDVHTGKVGGLLWFTNTCFVILAINYLGFRYTHKVKYLIWMAIGILLPVAGKGSRQDAVMSIVQLILFAAFINREQIHKAWEKGKISADTFGKALKRILIIILFILAAIVMVSWGIYRTVGIFSTESKYVLSIGYTGPGKGIWREILAWYYGYFSFSFNNLNNNILNTPIHENWLGLNSFKAFWFGLMRLSWFGFHSDAANQTKTILTTSATVTTTFWDFYYDYGNCCFIPMLISGIFYLGLKEKVSSPFSSTGAYLRYFYWASLWFFAAFNNVVFFDCVFTNMIILSIVVHFAFSNDSYYVDG